MADRSITQYLDDGSGTFIDVSTNNALPTIPGGNSSISGYSIPLVAGASLGVIPGVTQTRIGGLNIDIDTGTVPETIWEQGGLYNYSSTADIVSISSSDALDLQQVLITGLDSNYDEVQQIVTLNGQTPVTLNTPLLRAFLILNAGSSDIAGTVYLYVGTNQTGGVPNDPADIRMIMNGKNRSFTSNYTIPNGKTGLFLYLEISFSRSGGVNNATCAPRSRIPGGVFVEGKNITISGQGTSIYRDVRVIPDFIPAQTDIDLVCTEVSANNTALECEFGLLLIDDAVLPTISSSSHFCGIL